MGLHSPFGYVGYTVSTGQIMIDLLDKLCADCHTNDDYRRGCRECPAGQLIYECRDYIKTCGEDDKRFELYASEEWERRRGVPTPIEEKNKDREMAQDYKPECDKLREMQRLIISITPRPFFWGGRGERERPQRLIRFNVLLNEYADLVNTRLSKWGLKDIVKH